MATKLTFALSIISANRCHGLESLSLADSLKQPMHVTPKVGIVPHGDAILFGEPDKVLRKVSDCRHLGLVHQHGNYDEIVQAQGRRYLDTHVITVLLDAVQAIRILFILYGRPVLSYDDQHNSGSVREPFSIIFRKI